MQTKSLRWIAYPTTRIIWNLHPVAVGREETIHTITCLRKAGCDLSAACAERGIGRATYYRWQQRYRHCGARRLTPEVGSPSVARPLVAKSFVGGSRRAIGLATAPGSPNLRPHATANQGFGAFWFGIMGLPSAPRPWGES